LQNLWLNMSFSSKGRFIFPNIEHSRFGNSVFIISFFIFLFRQIIFHGTDRKSLHQYMSPKCLPSQYGGTLEMKTIDGPEWYSLLIQVDKEYEGMSKG